MAMKACEICEWLSGLGPSRLVGVDDGGLTLKCVERPDVYLEIGGLPEEEPEASNIPEDTIYTICELCDHFVDVNDDDSIAQGCAKYIHLDDGEQEYDHDASPRYSQSIKGWRKQRPDLFKKYPDGKIGPNSVHHFRKGKVDDNAVPQD
jgi:hypothetical protein